MGKTTKPIYHCMHIQTSRISPLAGIVLALMAGVLYASTHLANGWLFSGFEISPHISLVYLPSFLRLVNVLVLGLLWGTLGTAIGGALLFFWMQDSLFLSMLNTSISAGSAALAIVLMEFMRHRRISLLLLSDLLQLAVFYALLNALAHHWMWSLLDTSQLVSPNQLSYMVLGDILGAVIGALLLRSAAKHTPLIQKLRQLAAEPAPHKTDD